MTAIPVSFLRPEAARRLITQPNPDFGLDYDLEALERIIDLTNGQPYLVQLIGHGLVTRFNRQSFEEGVERERRFSLADVEAVIGGPEFYRDGNAYFTGVWGQAKQGPPRQQTILTTLAHGPATGEDLAAQSGLSLEPSLAALKTLRRHDVVKQTDAAKDKRVAPALPGAAFNETDISAKDEWGFTVELMRRWVEVSE